jgi:hypothetical protein
MQGDVGDVALTKGGKANLELGLAATGRSVEHARVDTPWQERLCQQGELRKGKQKNAWPAIEHGLQPKSKRLRKPYSNGWGTLSSCGREGLAREEEHTKNANLVACNIRDNIVQLLLRVSGPYVSLVTASNTPHREREMIRET